jgi:hypothetical protein
MISPAVTPALVSLPKARPELSRMDDHNPISFPPLAERTLRLVVTDLNSYLDADPPKADSGSAQRLNAPIPPFP